MKKHWLKKIRLILRIKTFTKSIRDYINSMAQEDSHSLYYEENKRKIIEKIIGLIDLSQAFLAPDGSLPELSDYEALPPEKASLSLSQLLVLFRRTLTQLQNTSPKIQAEALEILYSYFIELQGLYDLIFVSLYESNSSIVPLSPSALEEHQRRYLKVPEEIEQDPLLQEYQSIKYKDLMNVSSLHHLHVVLLDFLPQYLLARLQELLFKQVQNRNILDPASVTALDELRALLVEHPLSKSTKLSVAIHRHTMRICDILFTRVMLRWGRPLFELLVLATWIQTVKDHIVPGIHRPAWKADHLDIEQEVRDNHGSPGKIKMSSAFFMQPRIKFRLERFLIFKIRTMTVGEIVRTTELGNWMRQNSPDELLQFFNIALGDIGGIGIRTMPEHEILETKETTWLYDALMNFVPGGMTSPGSIVMRNTNYGLTKAQQLLQEIRFYDPRFKGSSSLFNDIKILIRSLGVINKGRVGKNLDRTESFTGKKREL
ncbi:sugar transferase [Candidatus Vecturithrix granuli]|uniref:Sugar transferase n=1 Tax=Vecturithrix granuli TaxID=1499967 RepID=A0A081C066_VECG1|nr:sugar transferase [Candidatus Vecturithrix granuli]